MIFLRQMQNECLNKLIGRAVAFCNALNGYSNILAVFVDLPDQTPGHQRQYQYRAQKDRPRTGFAQVKVVTQARLKCRRVVQHRSPAPSGR